MKLEYSEKARLTEYCRHRIEQFQEYRKILEFFGAEHKLDPYISGLNNVLQELEGKNDSHTMLDNVFYLKPQMFFLDIMAIVNGEALPLPDALLEIPGYLAELERLKKEAEKKLQAEIRAEENRVLFEKWRREDEERKERERNELCLKLGIRPEALVKLQEVQ